MLHRCLLLLVVTLIASPFQVNAEPPTASLDDWFDQVFNLCGEAFLGELTVNEPAGDDSWSTKRLVMHVRGCEENRLSIPLHVGDDRSRTWLLTLTEEGVQLQHDHRHEDGTADAVTMYGGLGTEREGSAVHFPADEETKKLFMEQGLEVSVDNVWTLELVPGERLSYILRRPGRQFQVDFDLTAPIDPPPAPWGH